MQNEIAEQFLQISVSLLEHDLKYIDDCLRRLSTEQLWWRAHEQQNSIGNLVVHLCGNIRQWIISAIGKLAPDTRDRNAEFAARGNATPEEMRRHLNDTMSEALAVLRQLTAERLLEQVRTALYERSVLQAIYASVEHFAQHTGQIMFITKQLTGKDLGYHAQVNPAKANK